jgi:hypothetical protein
MFVCRQRDRVKSALRTGLAVLALAFAGVGARADDSKPAAQPPDPGVVRNVVKKIETTVGVSRNHVARTVAKTIGIATDPAEPQDFVVKTRPTDAQDYIPIGRKEFEHPIKIKTPAELKAMEAGFDTVNVRHAAIRSTFAPAVKAVADAEAAKAAKAAKKNKTAPAPASPQ